MGRHVLAIAGAVALVSVAAPARANGRFPASNQVLFAPTQPSWVVVRTTFGVAFSKDSGSTWSWLCEDTLGLSSTSNEDPYFALTANNTLLAGLSLGLEVSPDTGCSWSTVGGPL